MLRKLFLICILAFMAQERPTFEVASIKEHPFAPGLMGVDFRPDGRVVATQAPLQWLIMAAYAILPAQLEFAPNVADAALKTNYDIEAKPGNAIPPGRLSRESKRNIELMLQNLLADRFKLKLHPETRNLASYALVVAEDGAKLQPAKSPDSYSGAL